jgi:hypothetical protein
MPTMAAVNFVEMSIATGEIPACLNPFSPASTTDYSEVCV